MTTDPLHVLAHAVETAQRTASEIVADAIRAAEQAGYERGRREASAGAPATARILTALKRATGLVAEVESTGTSIDGLCDDMTVVMKRRGRRVDPITIPDATDSFGDIDKWLGDHGGRELIDPDNAEVDADEVRNASQSIVADLAKLTEALDEIRCILTGEEPEGIIDTSRRTDADESDDESATESA
jgi:hypothetical protein